MIINKKNIAKYLTLFLLGVFALGITPWEAFHDHSSTIIADSIERDCLHSGHVKAKPAKCIVCVSHFDSIFILNSSLFKYVEKAVQLKYVEGLFNTSFTNLISTPLRGPPSRV